jgi:hypothetical protein
VRYLNNHPSEKVLNLYIQINIVCLTRITHGEKKNDPKSDTARMPGKPGSKSAQDGGGQGAAGGSQEKKGPVHLSKAAKKAKNVKANHGGKTDRKPH